MDVAWSTNRELFASDDAGMTDRLRAEAVAGLEPELADMMGRVREGLTAYEAGPYQMTDDKAPVELLGMQVIDDLIGGEVEYYKDIYEEEGIAGLLRQLG